MNMAETINLDSTAHYDQYERLLQKIAVTTLPRAMALEPMMDFDEMMGFYNEVYIRCKARFKPESGYKFSTYLQSACYHEFNKWCGKLERYRRTVTTTSVDALRRSGEHDGGSNYEFFPDESASAEDLIDGKKQRVLYAERVAALPDRYRQVVAILVEGPGPNLRARFTSYQEQQKANGRHVPEEITADFICRSLGFTAKEAQTLRRELDRKFKVDFPSLNRRAFS